MTTDLKIFLGELYDNLNILQERAAKYGGNAPLELLNQISDHKQAIQLTKRALQGELTWAEWRQALKPLLIAIEDRSAENEAAASSVTIGNITNGIKGSIIAGRDVIIQ